LGAHLETALRGVIIGERWPKSGVDVIITILEGEEDHWWGEELVGTTVGAAGVGGWGLMTVLAASITAASAALIDAGIDCVDIVAGGVASVVRNPGAKGTRRQLTSDEGSERDKTVVLDPSPSEHKETLASCVVGYLPQRDEITEIWMSGDAGLDPQKLTDGAIEAARLTSTVLTETLKDLAKEKFAEVPAPNIQTEDDIAMVG
jgi:exosome complex component MTR3